MVSPTDMASIGIGTQGNFLNTNIILWGSALALGSLRAANWLLSLALEPLIADGVKLRLKF